MMAKEGPNQACAACKFQRRKCSAECQFAPYFPADQPKLFENAHSLFGVSNILKILSSIDPSLRSEAMRSIIYESNIRARFPVDGCAGAIRQLFNQLCTAQMELASLTEQIVSCHRSENGAFPAGDVGDGGDGGGGGAAMSMLRKEIAVFSQNIHDGQLHLASQQPCENNSEESKSTTEKAELKGEAELVSLRNVGIMEDEDELFRDGEEMLSEDLYSLSCRCPPWK